MRARAFTLIELLIVIAIVALLVALMVPSFSKVKELARSAACVSNLHHLGGAFTLALGTKPRPDPDQWPQCPQDAAPDAGIYLCPEADNATPDISQYEIWLQDEGYYITFEDTSAIEGLCNVFDRGEYVEYWFDDGWYRDVDDFLFHVSKTNPKVATFRPDLAGIGHGRIVSLCRRREVVPGWEDLRNRVAHDSFTLDGEGLTNYGINARLTETSTPAVVLLLDYTRMRAHSGEDVTLELDQAARHLGQLNVLWADLSVRAAGPTALDPWVHPELWEP